MASSLGFEKVEKTINLSGGSVTVNFILEENTEGLDEVVIATRRETGYVAKEQTALTFGTCDILNIPQSVSIITQEVLLDQQVRFLEDFVRNDPSIIVSNPPGP